MSYSILVSVNVTIVFDLLLQTLVSTELLDISIVQICTFMFQIIIADRF